MRSDPEIVGRYVYLTVEGVEYRVYYEECGQGVPLVCQHTAGAEGRQWRHLLEDPEVTSRFRVIVPDLPFHGKSLPPSDVTWWDQEYTLTKAFIEEFVVTVSRHLGLERPVFMGCSMGGHLAPDLALDRPDDFRAVIGVQAAIHSHGAEGLMAYLDHPDMSNDFRAAQMFGICSPTSPEAWRRETAWIYSQGSPPVFKGDLNYYFIEHDLTGVASDIDTSRVAVYVLSGEYDYSAHPGLGRELADQIEGSTFVPMAGLGHFPMAENYPLFKQYLMPVLDDVLTKSGDDDADRDDAAAIGHADADAVPIGVSCRGLTRSFGSTLALDDVDLDVATGTIHALVGQNGAGKSTCLGIIAGRIRPTGGQLFIGGESHQYGSPRAAQEAGVAAVYQELTVIPQLSPQANVFLPHPLTRGGFLRRSAMRKRYEQTCAELGTAPAPDVPVGRLTVAQQQLVEITRAVMSDSRILLLDEPTAALALEERRALYRLLRSLRDGGSTIMLVSHNLADVLGNADVVTVFRDGRVIETRPAADWTKAELIKNMLGDSSRDLLAAETTGRKPRDTAADSGSPQAAVRLRAENIQLAGRVSDVSFDVRAGEVLGIVGLMGSGRSSLLRALGGLEPHASGRVEVDGVSTSCPSSPRAAQALGIGLLPEDRKTQGVCLRMSAAANVALPRLGAVGKLGYLSPRRVESTTAPYLAAAGVPPTKSRHLAGSLSGGNQQKLLFARMSFIQPGVLLADEPTRGVDIGAKTDILEEVRRLAREEGVAVVLVSSETEEVIAFSDRILVMAGGRVVEEFDAGEVSDNQLLQGAFHSNDVSV